MILGDVLNNARAALDYVAWQLARLHHEREPTESEAPEIQFPLAKNSGHFLGSKVSAHVCRDAFKEMGFHQPYLPDPDGASHTNSLAVLRDLSNSDKHRLPVVGFPMMTANPYNLEFDPPVTSYRTEGWGQDEQREMEPFEGGVRLALGKLIVEPQERAAETSVKVDSQPGVSVRFYTPGHHYGYFEVERLIQRVENVLGSFDRFFDGAPHDAPAADSAQA